MRLSHFWRLMEGEFGASYAHVLADTLVLSAHQLTVTQALDAGIPAREVWESVCDQQDVPAERRLGKDVPPRR